MPALYNVRRLVNIAAAHCNNQITGAGNFLNLIGYIFKSVHYANIVEPRSQILAFNAVGVFFARPMIGVSITLSAMESAFIKSSFKSAVREKVKG